MKTLFLYMSGLGWYVRQAILNAFSTTDDCPEQVRHCLSRAIDGFLELSVGIIDMDLDPGYPIYFDRVVRPPPASWPSVEASKSLAPEVCPLGVCLPPLPTPSFNPMRARFFLSSSS